MNFGSILTKLLKAAKLCGLAQHCKTSLDTASSAMLGAAGDAGGAGEGGARRGAARRQWRVADTTWDRVR